MNNNIEVNHTALDDFYDKYRDAIYTFGFGILSALLGLVKLNTPGFEGSYSDLREVALIICLFHLRNPIYIIPLCLLTLLGIPFETRLIAVFIMHVIPLTITWYIYSWLNKKRLGSVNFGLIWNFLVFIYFALLLYPILIISYQFLGFNTDANFISSYKSIFISGEIEMITTSFISALYLIQLNMQRKLRYNNKNLEKIVLQRTKELSEANHELVSLNENLENIIKDRTKKINTQLAQITKYAHLNSHEVRAPLARILGLISLVKIEKDPAEINSLISLIDENSIELDQIVRKMNLLLGPEAENQ